MNLKLIESMCKNILKKKKKKNTIIILPLHLHKQKLKQEFSILNYKLHV